MPLRRYQWLILALGALTLPGCISISKVSELDKLDARVRKAENRRRGELMALDNRIRALESRNHYLEGMVTALGGGAASSPPATAGAPASGTGAKSSGAPSKAFLAAPPPAPVLQRLGSFGGIYRQAIATDPPKLDPAHLQDTTSHRVGAQMLEGLVEFDDELAVVPCVAESWDIGPDETTYTFHLRSGVKFHHGREVVAEDFVYSFGRVLDPNTISPRTWLFDNILGYPTFQAFRRAGDAASDYVAGKPLDLEKLAEHRKALEAIDAAALRRLRHPRPKEALALAKELTAFLGMAHLLETDANSDPEKSKADARALAKKTNDLSSWDFLKGGLEAKDEHTFVVRLAKPFAPFLSVLAMVNAAVVPKDEVERLGEDFAFQPVGTGPFKFVRWDHDVVVELEAFEDYFQGRPYLDKLTFRIIPDESTTLTEFQVGNLESVNKIPDEKYEAIKADPNFPGVLVERPILHVFYIGMNVEKPPFDNVLVRRAFNHAIDRRPIIEKIRKGRGEIAAGPLPPGIEGYDPALKGYEYDPAKAKALLAQAGYAEPKDLGIVDFWFNSTGPADPNSKIAGVIQQYLRDLGVNFRLNPVDWGTYMDMVDRGDPQILRMAWIADYPDADNFLYVLFHSEAIGQGNASRYANDEVDALLEEARRSSDRPHRKRLYQKAQRKIVSDAPWIPLFHQLEPFLHKDYVKGAVMNGRGADAIRMKKVWLDRGDDE